jgi:hypothetical protein
MKWQEGDPGPEADPRGVLGGRRHDHRRGRTHPIAVVEVVLGKPYRVKSQRFGVGDLVEQLGVKIDVRSLGRVVVAKRKE